MFVAATTAEPVASHVCTEIEDGGTPGQLALIDYAHRENGVAYPLNIGAWLTGRVRRWAELDGYCGIIGRPADEIHRSVLKRASIPQL